ncbi:aminotransferase class III-fold pyridoxal phosphate-dependent enzyme [Salinibacterium sp. dk2585]|uniref:aspartate aminotransferase family protein n=1 Tax=unclassified Salinibacterium TaxID=2632331 RepID=UPI0011C242F7|nr:MULTISPECIES: aminotransferase class III-fold pyridoxal phosphate-dependent enzyme [unclassified Salinibacterium]QEE62112.1 aminotransferase class III-fold pyridoxal phosphate-dependent enzyme [Salinibacterium sp. dk2585]TXK53464.1 aminotransferase class III-fold pyridoxal phosphate-dependent enzyme [Salinibacterium sp. dk5596]
MTTVVPERDDYLVHPLPARAKQVMTRGNTRSTLYVPPAPPYAVKGEGAIVTDQLGHEVIDCNNNYTSLIHGHAQPDVTAAVTPLMAQGTAFGLPTESEITLAEMLAARTGHERWRFSNSGTEAVMTAIRAARAFTGRDKLIRFEGSYHGTSDAVVSVTAPGVTAGVRSDVIEVPQGDRAAFDAAVAEAGSDLAAVLIDLMPNRAGLVPAEQAFVDHVRETTRRVDALMIVDEVITLRMAFGGLAQAYGVKPDLISAGKIIGGGFPVGAVGGREDVLGVFDPLGQRNVGWGGTFSANPITMTAGRVAMALFDEEAIASLNARGNALRTALEEAGIAVSGNGSLMRIREQLDLGELWWAAYERGVMLGTNGLLALSTPMTDTHISTIERGTVDAVRALRGRTTT